MERVKKSSSPREKTACRYGKGCFTLKCPYYHPEPRTIDQSSNVSPLVKEGSMLEHVIASFAALEVRRDLPAAKSDGTPKKPRSENRASRNSLEVRRDSPADKSDGTPKKPRSENKASRNSLEVRRDSPDTKNDSTPIKPHSVNTAIGNSHEKRRTPQSAKSTSSSSNGTPIPHFREPVLLGAITEFHDTFKAAGAMFIRYDDDGDMQVLVGVEFRSRTQKRLHIIGGKRDFQTETHFDVAAREFWEETGKLISQATIHNSLSASTTKAVWIGAGKFVLYLVSECPTDLTDITERYAALTTKDEILSLHWCKWTDLITRNSKALPERISSFLAQIIDDVVRLKAIDSFMTTKETVEQKQEANLESEENNKIIHDYSDLTVLEEEAIKVAATLLENLIEQVTAPLQEEESTENDTTTS